MIPTSRVAPEDRAVLDAWHAVSFLETLGADATHTCLLGTDLTIRRGADGTMQVQAEGREAPLPVAERYDCLWTSLGTPPAVPLAIPEADEPDRRLVCCGSIDVHASGLRVVENFLDMAHFPFVHTNILGAEPQTEVLRYHTEWRRDVDEIWATDCRFHQPQAALSAEGGQDTGYIYRVASPFVTLLYKTCPNDALRPDVIALFVQPTAPDRCRAHPVMFLIDDVSAQADLIQFQQKIFLQDRIILENQRPRLLPLDARAEIPTRADSLSVTYRRWLKEKQVRYGATGALPAA
ncbi:aromatic ring-hydroxylating oxygenase subunit alpha [Gluconacetobacter takamatsuzukensis]|uniref:Aromatic ring-hydroxylating dioxygenase subunit alpha n=1 Tax=Gluconacetobacter takamatsuzukensis TaxID=1286190 RepID=A0A7W4KDR3_9PROT|nr:aromatic ring-hydroxylating dioxygenase subunit alpha [Gluconacetobacter takamatsuzukensis]MBB2205019.1 aromatic ring-hydroxylating dioxygenase subunit alpha [Gluconacetobacter takamatsuzukensis]